MSKYTDEELDHIIEQIFEDKPKTNKDVIQSMTTKELAKFINGIDHYEDDGEIIVNIGGTAISDDVSSIEDWLNMKVEEQDDDRTV